MKNTIALVGDFNESVLAHQAIPKAIEFTKTGVNYQWLATDVIDFATLGDYTGFWCVPASPYVSMQNVLEVIRHARKNNIPFLGTCGGYQHAALEFVRNALGYSEADNAEVNPDAGMPVVSALSCKLYGQPGTINLNQGSAVRSVYGSAQISEEYYCGYGVNPAYLSLFDDTDMCFTGFDADGDPRVLEIAKNRFFVGTAFQPERSAFSGQTHPLVTAFLRATQDSN